MSQQSRCQKLIHFASFVNHYTARCYELRLRSKCWLSRTRMAAKTPNPKHFLARGHFIGPNQFERGKVARPGGPGLPSNLRKNFHTYGSQDSHTFSIGWRRAFASSTGSRNILHPARRHRSQHRHPHVDKRHLQEGLFKNLHGARQPRTSRRGLLLRPHRQTRQPRQRCPACARPENQPQARTDNHRQPALGLHRQHTLPPC